MTYCFYRSYIVLLGSKMYNVVRVEVRVSSVGRDSVLGLGPVSGPGRDLKGRVRGRNCWVSGTPSRWNRHHKSLKLNSNVTSQMLPLFSTLCVTYSLQLHFSNQSSRRDGQFALLVAVAKAV